MCTPEQVLLTDEKLPYDTRLGADDLGLHQLLLTMPGGVDDFMYQWS